MYVQRFTSISTQVVMIMYGVVPKGLLTFLGFLGSAEFGPWKILPEFNKLRKSLKKILIISVRVFP